jgi:hypothetical protein
MPTPSEELPLVVDSEVCVCEGGVEVGAAVVAGIANAEDFESVAVEPVVAEALVVDEPVVVGPAIVDVGPVVGGVVVEVGAALVVVAATVGFEVEVVRDGPWAR